MFSIFKNDVSKRFPLRRGIRGRIFLSNIVFFFLFFLFSSTTNTPCHPERVKGARDLVLQALHSHSCSLLLLHTVFSCSLLSSPCASAPLQITLTFQQILFEIGRAHV